MSAGPQTPWTTTGSPTASDPLLRRSPLLRVGPSVLYSGGPPGPPTHQPAAAPLLDVHGGAAVSQAAVTAGSPSAEPAGSATPREAGPPQPSSSVPRRGIPYISLAAPQGRM
ncbi:hypothetical protein NDU88_011159 [Pleurodeles waltl]|uniref:Uncharacterized protein n=1 Tax=Pleurodeles waltl TaxID=8319 RepID=A0AAV7S3F5_PLEWA|nr:hypothetical protein NDU88_011159 [Pleurodeles waltl]